MVDIRDTKTLSKMMARDSIFRKRILKIHRVPENDYAKATMFKKACNKYDKRQLGIETREKEEILASRLHRQLDREYKMVLGRTTYKDLD